MSAGEQEVLDRGETSIARYLAGGAIGTYPAFYLPLTASNPLYVFALPGLGAGHAIQGRFLETGWIFLLGELGSAALGYALARSECPDGRNSPGCHDGPVRSILIGGIPYAFFRLWELGDLWISPLVHNRQFHKLKGRMNPGPLTFFVTPTSDKSFVLGASYRF